METATSTLTNLESISRLSEHNIPRDVMDALWDGIDPLSAYIPVSTKIQIFEDLKMYLKTQTDKSSAILLYLSNISILRVGDEYYPVYTSNHMLGISNVDLTIGHDNFKFKYNGVEIFVDGLYHNELKIDKYKYIFNYICTMIYRTFNGNSAYMTYHEIASKRYNTTKDLDEGF